MPTQLPLARHLDGLRAAMVAFVRYAERAGLDAAVPTCPDWTVRDLAAHLGMPHRWATALLRGQTVEDPEAWMREGAAEADPLEWLRDGAVELAQTLHEAPEDVAALVFLRDAPPPREFWARRQCHETTVHAIDAQAAALGRLPRPEEVDWVTDDVAEDGIDELLAGFLTRRRASLRTEEESVLVVAPDDADDYWVLTLSSEPAVTVRRTGAVSEDADWVLTGSARELYLRLWNRTEPPDTTGLDWPALSAVNW